MRPPFSPEQFFDVFHRYNEAVWPAQVFLTVLALFIAFAAYRANVRRSWHWAQLSIVLLASLWLWTGIAYHKVFCRKRLRALAALVEAEDVAQLGKMPEEKVSRRARGGHRDRDSTRLTGKA